MIIYLNKYSGIGTMNQQFSFSNIFDSVVILVDRDALQCILLVTLHVITLR